MFERTFLMDLTASPRRRRARPALQLRLECLEDRCLLSTYAFIDLGSLAGGVYSVARDLNASGQVVGTLAPGVEVNFPDNPIPERGVLWHDGAMIDLGTLGGRHSSAFGINDLGQIVGWATTPDSIVHAFLITPEDADADGAADLWNRDSDGDGANDLMVDLGANGGDYSVARDVNNIGQVVGYGVVPRHSFLWQDGTIIDLGDGGFSSMALAINDVGQVAGSNNGGAFLWQNGVMTNLGLSARGPLGDSVDVNASGQVTFAWGVWTPTTPNGTVGTTTYLAPGIDWPEYPGSAVAFGLNNAGQVVGSTYWAINGGEDGGGGELHVATLWNNGNPQLLSDLLVPTPPPFWNGGYASAINDAGQIIVNGWSNGPVLLTPIPDDMPLITIGDVTVTEGNSGTQPATFDVALSVASSQFVTVSFATADSTATAGSDYQLAADTLIFAPGETTKSITVLVNADTVVEPNETFHVNLSSVNGATIADGQGVGTIVNDDFALPKLRISDVTRKEGRKGTTHFTFTVTLSAPFTFPVTVSYATADGTAKASSGDYIGTSGMLTFAPGETSKTIIVKVKGDRKQEADETFFVNLFAAEDALIEDDLGIGTILNDD